MAVHVQLRRGTASEWTVANPILAEGELGLEKDTGKFKVGNGTNAWSVLSYSSGTTGPQGAAGPQGTQGVLGAASTVAGPQGAASTVAGPQGAVGAQGSTGVGTQGAQGPQGAASTVAGPQGDPGVVGPAGAAGTNGTNGVQGYQGDTGPQGTSPFTTNLVSVTAASTTSTPMIVSGVLSQSASLQEWRNSTGLRTAWIGAGGQGLAVTAGQAFQTTMYVDSGGPQLWFGTTASPSGMATVSVNGPLTFTAKTRGVMATRDDAGITFTVKSGTSNASDLQQWTNSSNTVLASISKDGGARFVPRVTTFAAPTTITVNTDIADAVTVTGITSNITSITTTGTPANFDKLVFRFNGQNKTLTWGSLFVAGGVALPTLLVNAKTLTVGFIYDTVAVKWCCIAVSQEA